MNEKAKITPDEYRDLPDWLTRPQVARLLGLERNAVDYRLKKNLLPSKLVLDVVMIPKKAVKAEVLG